MGHQPAGYIVKDLAEIPGHHGGMVVGRDDGVLGQELLYPLFLLRRCWVDVRFNPADPMGQFKGPIILARLQVLERPKAIEPLLYMGGSPLFASICQRSHR